MPNGQMLHKPPDHSFLLENLRKICESRLHSRSSPLGPELPVPHPSKLQNSFSYPSACVSSHSTITLAGSYVIHHGNFLLYRAYRFWLSNFIAHCASCSLPRLLSQPSYCPHSGLGETTVNKRLSECQAPEQVPTHSGGSCMVEFADRRSCF